jgi:glycosyltransferase involved in cell wall biosynthesis
MRIALVSHNAQAGDAIGNLLAEKLAFFLDHGADVRLFVETDHRLHPALRAHGRKLAPEPKGDGWRFLASADLVLVEYGHYYRLLELLPLLRGGKGRILLDYHGVTPPDLWPAHNREGIEAGLRNRGLVWCADAAVAHSRFTRAELQEATGFPPDRLSCLAHPTDTGFFSPGAPDQSLGSLLGLPDASILLFVGRLAPNKRVPVLVEALARLRDLTPPVHAVVIGDSGDAYQAEAAGCRDLAARLGVADRFHLLGRVDQRRLRDAYRCAAVFVMPSRHEGYCLPVREAMASGLPVVAARAGALPETVAYAGLSFTPDDADDLARQVRRILKKDKETRRQGDKETEGGKSHPNARPGFRVCVVAGRYGNDFAGGAETSLRTIAETLHLGGHRVEVFTTCAGADNPWSNRLSEGESYLNGVTVRRFRIDPHLPERYGEALRAILQAGGEAAPEVEQDYLDHLPHSAGLLACLRERSDEFDAVITGPYLSGLALDVARAVPDQTLLLPCFHDEPLARLRAWRAYDRVGGLLFHSPEEQDFAQSRLGFNHPGAAVLTPCLDRGTAGDSHRAQGQGGDPDRYLVYCGRYAAEKGLPTLLDYARRYLALHPTRFAFVFLGQGGVAVPKHPRLRDLGFVPESVKRDLLAGAAALVQLSRNESLSYVTLEAWAQGTPVIADERCAAIAGHLRRCGGGRAVASFEDFAHTLDDLWEHPEAWQRLGHKGLAYVRQRYASREEFGKQLEGAIRGLRVPLAARLRARGLERAAAGGRSDWRQRFAGLVEGLLDAGPRPCREQVEVKIRAAQREAAAGSGTVPVPVRVVNRGSHALLAEGPGRAVLRCRVMDGAGNLVGSSFETSLPGLLMPGRALAAAVPVPVPAEPGTYRVGIRVGAVAAWPEDDRTPEQESWLHLTVHPEQGGPASSCCAPLLDAARAALGEAEHCRRLPVDYTDVTEGFLASWKRRLKRKLLGNFKHAYVDVLSRQQSQFNQNVLASLHELAECCATLDHAASAVPSAVPAAAEPLADLCRELGEQLAECRQRCATLEERLARLEARVSEREVVPGQRQGEGA